MKKILITQRLTLNDNYYELREVLDVKWGALLQEIEFLPIIAPCEFNFEVYFNQIKIDGILLTGGNDLHSLNKNDTSLKRDLFEKKIIDYGINNNIPIFGVCRGMQVIAGYFGASFEKAQNQVAIKHRLIVNPASKYYNLLNEIDEVNAYHNYSIKKIPANFLVSATNDNKMIKAIEHTKYRIFAQMWHSERENPFSQAELALIKNFFNNQTT